MAGTWSSPQIATSFNRDGFFVARSIIPPELLESIRKQMHRIVGAQLGYLGVQPTPETTQQTMHADFTKLYSLDQSRYLASLRLCGRIASVYQFYLLPEMLELAKNLRITLPVFQTQPVLHIMADSLRIKDGYFGVGVHQDWPALQSGLDTLTVWIPLFPVRKNQFTLEVIPGSHLLGLVDAKQEQHIHEVDPKVYENKVFEPVQIDAGDAFFFSTFLLHKSELSGSPDAFRVAFSMRYENGEEKSFIRRSYPTAQKRVVERFLAEADVPSRNDVLEIYQGGAGT